MSDRVELTDDEFATVPHLSQLDSYADARDIKKAVERLLAARVAALAAEWDTLRIDLRTCERLSREAADAARAELAAANARCAELQARLDGRGASQEFVMRFSEAEFERLEAERDALQATLDRVTALADEWEAKAGEGIYSQERERAAALRAALTPEGKP